MPDTVGAPGGVVPLSMLVWPGCHSHGMVSCDCDTYEWLVRYWCCTCTVLVLLFSKRKAFGLGCDHFQSIKLTLDLSNGYGWQWCWHVPRFLGRDSPPLKSAAKVSIIRLYLTFELPNAKRLRFPLAGWQASWFGVSRGSSEMQVRCKDVFIFLLLFLHHKESPACERLSRKCVASVGFLKRKL